MLTALFGHPKDNVARGLTGHATLSCLSQPLGSLQGQGWHSLTGGLVAASFQGTEFDWDYTYLQLQTSPRQPPPPPRSTSSNLPWTPLPPAVVAHRHTEGTSS